ITLVLVLNNLTNTEPFQSLNSTDNNDSQTMQLFKHYKLILNDALKIIKEQENI
ncbi:13162_t:CDS:1, partial [Cetraspora pellucida]